MASNEQFCGNPMCEFHRVAATAFSSTHTIHVKRRGRTELLNRTTHRLVRDDGAILFEKDLCDICGNVIDMIDPENGIHSISR